MPGWLAVILLAGALGLSAPLACDAARDPDAGRNAAGAASASGERSAPAFSNALADFTLARWPFGPKARRGDALYRRHCAGCHGAGGEGDGPAARFLDPRPRNLIAARFKFISTEGAASRQDLERTIAWGLAESAMPGFPDLPRAGRQALVEYLIELAAFGFARALAAQAVLEDDEPLAEVLARLSALRQEALATLARRRTPLVVPAEPPVTPAGLARGRRLYALLACDTCHGDAGHGDGPVALTLRDFEDAPTRPTDFATHGLRFGGTMRDLWMRLRAGLGGTPMPAALVLDAGGKTGGERLWELAHYVRTLQRGEAPPAGLRPMEEPRPASGQRPLEGQSR